MDGKSVGGVHIENIGVTRRVGSVICYGDSIRKVMPGENGVRIIVLGYRKVRKMALPGCPNLSGNENINK